MVAQNLYQYWIITNIEAMKFQLCETKGITSKQDLTGCSLLHCWPRLFIQKDSAWFCKILLNSVRFCKILKHFARFMKNLKHLYQRFLLRNYQRLKQTLPIWRYGVQKLNYQRSKLPILKVTNIEVYLYTKLPPKFVIGLIHSMWLLSSSQNTFMDYNI